MKRLLASVIIFFPVLSFSQWSVYDEKVYEELSKINRVKELGSNVAKLDQHFKSLEASGSSGQTVTFGTGSDKVEYKGVDTKFEELTVNDATKYIGTDQDCGSNDAKFLKHYNACVGLRNLRLQTLKQSHDMLKVLAKRREEIVSLIKLA